MVKPTNSTATAHAYKTVGPMEFAKEIKANDVYLLDVRTQDEFKEGHISGAHNLDVTDDNFTENAKATLPDHMIIAVYCGTGMRSAKAAEELSNAEYKVLDLDGGLNRWKAAGLATVK